MSILPVWRSTWNLNGQLGLVDDAMYLAEIERVRAVAPTLPLLVSCVGTKGGDAAITVKASWRPDVPIISNSSRAMVYAFRDAVLAEAARRVALKSRDVLKADRGETPVLIFKV